MYVYISNLHYIVKEALDTYTQFIETPVGLVPIIPYESNLVDVIVDAIKVPLEIIEAKEVENNEENNDAQNTQDLEWFEPSDQNCSKQEEVYSQTETQGKE